MASTASPEAHPPRRPTEPLVFPVEAEVPETRRHLELRTLLFEILRRAFGAEATVGSDQFVYWNAADPRRCLAPDVFVRVGVRDHSFDSWKTWERGAPQIAVEIISESDSSPLSWEEKLARYQELGVIEVLRFDERAAAGQRLRRFERLEERLVETDVTGDRVASSVLPLTWVVAAGPGLDVSLRAERADGTLWPAIAEELDAEVLARARETREREAETRAREAETRAKEAAERRVLELEEELGRRG